MDPIVSTEYTALAVSNLKDLSWDYEPPDPLAETAVTRRRGGCVRPRSITHVRPREGPRSLFSIALDVAAENIQNFHDEYLESLPKPEWIQRMWKQLDPKKGDLSLETWKKFNKYVAQRGDKENEVLQHFFMHISIPTAADFAVYTKPLQSAASFDFVAHLRISGPCQIKQRDLVLLTGLRNLGVLEVVEPRDASAPFPRLNDRLVKTWSFQDNPFPRLLILKVYSPYALTEESIRYVNKFPKLALFEILGERKHWRRANTHAKDHGWADVDVRRTAKCAYPPPGSFPSRYAPHIVLAEHVADEITVKPVHDRCRWACWAHATIELMLKDTAEKRGKNPSRGPVRCESALPVASLSLGHDWDTIDQVSTGMLPQMARILFWRRSLFPGADAPLVPEEAGHEGNMSTPPEKRQTTAPSESKRGLAARHSKRRRVGNVRDVLDGFGR